MTSLEAPEILPSTRSRMRDFHASCTVGETRKSANNSPLNKQLRVINLFHGTFVRRSKSAKIICFVPSLAYFAWLVWKRWAFKSLSWTAWNIRIDNAEQWAKELAPNAEEHWTFRLAHAALMFLLLEITKELLLHLIRCLFSGCLKLLLNFSLFPCRFKSKSLRKILALAEPKAINIPGQIRRSASLSQMHPFEYRVLKYYIKLV